MKKTLTHIFVFISTLIAAEVVAQDSEKAAQETSIANLVDSKSFIFQAQSVSPMRARTLQLSPGSFIAVSPDTVMADLPYFGRAYSAGYSPSDAGVKFTSLEFEYTVKNRKKGGWDISIKPKDVQHSPQVFLSVSTKGTVIVRVTSTDKESISYNGYIEKIQKR